MARAKKSVAVIEGAPAKTKAAPGAAGKSLANIDAELAKEVANIRESIGQASGNKIKVEPAGNFILPDGSNLGDEIQIVIVDYVSRNNFYMTPFNKDNPSPPDCYAMGKAINDMTPEEDSPAIQSDACRTCPMNQFGSGQNGKSKACKNSRLLTVLVIDPDNPDATDEPGAPLYTLEISPTSIKAFDGVVSNIERSLAGPPIKAMVTVIARPVGTYAVLSFVDPVPNPSYALHFQRRPETVDMLYRRPDFAAYEAKAPPRRAKPAPRRATPARR